MNTNEIINYWMVRQQMLENALGTISQLSAEYQASATADIESMQAAHSIISKTIELLESNNVLQLQLHLAREEWLHKGKDAGITRVLDCADELDPAICEKLKDMLYEQDYQASLVTMVSADNDNNATE